MNTVNDERELLCRWAPHDNKCHRMRQDGQMSIRVKNKTFSRSSLSPLGYCSQQYFFIELSSSKLKLLSDCTAIMSTGDRPQVSLERTDQIGA